MIGTLIGDVGILEPTAMDDFNDFFEAYQNLGKKDPEEKKAAEKYLAAYREGGSKATRPMPKNTLKCIGVWDTVGALGIRMLKSCHSCLLQLPWKLRLCGDALLLFFFTFSRNSWFHESVV